MNQRETDYFALRETYAHLLGKRWTGNRLFGCYEIIRDYYKEFLAVSYTHLTLPTKRIV